MSKPYDLTSPLVTEKTMESVANVIDTNYAKKTDLAGVDLSELKTAVDQIKADHAEILAALEEWV